MKRLFIGFAIFLILLLPGKATGGSYSEKTINKALKLATKVMSDHLGESLDETGLETLPINMGLKNYSGQDTLFLLLNGSSESKAYLVISSAKGRYERFDFMVLYQMDKKLVEIRILTYRSEHGSQVSSKKWLNKFTELDPRKGHRIRGRY